MCVIKDLMHRCSSLFISFSCVTQLVSIVLVASRIIPKADDAISVPRVTHDQMSQVVAKCLSPSTHTSLPRPYPAGALLTRCNNCNLLLCTLWVECGLNTYLVLRTTLFYPYFNLILSITYIFCWRSTASCYHYYIAFLSPLVVPPYLIAISFRQLLHIIQ